MKYMNRYRYYLLFNILILYHKLQEGIKKSLSELNEASAKEKLSHLLSKFYSFTEGVKLNDDLTVIILQKV